MDHGVSGGRIARWMVGAHGRAPICGIRIDDQYSGWEIRWATAAPPNMATPEDA